MQTRIFSGSNIDQLGDDINSFIMNYEGYVNFKYSTNLTSDNQIIHNILLVFNEKKKLTNNRDFDKLY